jgi:hypothetical protein
MTQGHRITRRRGDTYPVQITITDSAGDPVDITGASFVLTVNAVEDPDTPGTEEFDLTGAIVAPATDGVVEFTPTAGDVDLVGRFFYDVQMTDVSGHIRTILAGVWDFVQDITK